jgi:murein DD-endopeptidase MepM/ murein hydrolase activator NlpD
VFGLDGKLQGAERYAIDWIRVDPGGRIYHGNPAVLSNWAGYGAKLLAVGNGVVTEAIDNRKNRVPLVKPTTLEFEQLPGNLVVIRLRGGLSAVYAHLIPGSVRVRVGERVHTGQVLGLLGNSGGSLAPHLHFHIVSGPSAAASDGYPYTLNHFKLAANANIEDLAVALKGGAGFPPRSRLKPRPRSRQLPLGFTIDDFPALRR